ncbi:MAG: YdeI/OmpD-associated family protein [Bryobacteraceae bacterium]
MVKNVAPILEFRTSKRWEDWLRKNHSRSAGVWLRLAKSASGVRSVTYGEALEAALCYGWIDGQKKSESENAWLQRFILRKERSVWSKVNRRKALALIEAGRMQPAGLRAIERAKANGHWEAAYDSPRTATVPADLQAALDASPRAKAFFVTLNSQNRYAVLYRIQTARKAETRSKRIAQFVAMLGRHEKLHP